MPATREEAGAADELPPIDLDEVQIWDLLAAFTRLMGEIGVRKTTHEVIDDDAPMELHAADVEDRLERFGAQTLRQLFTARRSRGEVIGVFLAILELIREKRIIARFSENGDDVAFESAPRPPTPVVTNEEPAVVDDELARDLAHDLAEPIAEETSAH